MKRIWMILLCGLFFVAVLSSCTSAPKEEEKESKETQEVTTTEEVTTKSALELCQEASKKTGELDSKKVISQVKYEVVSASGGEENSSTIIEEAEQILNHLEDKEKREIYSKSKTSIVREGEDAPLTTEETFWIQGNTGYIIIGDSKRKRENILEAGIEEALENGSYNVKDEAFEEVAFREEDGKKIVELSLGKSDYLTDGEKERYLGLNELSSFLGVSGELFDEIIKTAEISNAELTVVIRNDGYYDSTSFRVFYRFTLTKEIQEKMYGVSSNNDIQFEIAMDHEETYVDPGTEHPFELPDDLESFIPYPTIEEKGAKGFLEIHDILFKNDLFSEEQVACMTQQFLFACIYVCDPDNAIEIYETWDIILIRNLLNEKLFDEVKKKPYHYIYNDYYSVDISKEDVEGMLQDISQYINDYIEVYGIRYYMNVLEETEGKEEEIAPIYTIVDVDGNKKSKLSAVDQDEGLYIIRSNGRYYWEDYSLFENLP